MLVLLTSIALAARPEPIERTLPTEMPSLTIENASGLTRVRMDEDAGKSTVTVRQGLLWAEGCEVVFTGNREQAVATVTREGERAGMRCRARFDVVLAGPTTLDLDTRSGRIRGKDLEQVASAHAGFGSVDLRFAEAPAGTVSAKVGVGRARVHFPYGTWLDLDTDTVVGHVATEIPNREDAITDLNAEAKLGGVGVRTVLVPWEQLQPPAPAVATSE